MIDQLELMGGSPTASVAGVRRELARQGVPAPMSPQARMAWLQGLLDEYVAAIGTERPRRSEYRALMASLADGFGFPLTEPETVAIEVEAARKLFQADTQKARARRIFVTIINALVAK